MANTFNFAGNTYSGNFGSRITGYAGSPVEGTGLQPDLKVPYVPYRGTNWGAVEDVAGNKRRQEEERLERERLAEERRIAAYKRTFKYRFMHFFGLA